MTFDERVAALTPLGFTPRQTRFLVTAAPHSGYCLRRQYLAFAGVRYGKNVCDFLEALVRRRLAHPLCVSPTAGTPITYMRNLSTGRSPSPTIATAARSVRRSLRAS